MFHDMLNMRPNILAPSFYLTPSHLWYDRRGRHNKSFSDMYHQTSNISRTLVGNKIIVHSDVVGAIPTSSSFAT